MRAAVLLSFLALALAEKASTSKRGIGPEAFAPAKSQDTGSSFNLQALIGNQQLPSYSQGYDLPGDLSAYPSPYFGQEGGDFLGGHITESGYRIPPQTAPPQKPAQLALVAAAAVAQQNFGHPAYGAPPPQNPDAQQVLIQNLSDQLNSLPQYQEYNQQIQAYVRQPVALNFGNTRINAFPPPRPQNIQPISLQAQPRPQLLQSTFQEAFSKGVPYGGFTYDAVLGNHLGDQSLFRPAPAQVAAEVPQPAPIQYAAPQPAPPRYSQPLPSYDFRDAKGSAGAFSYSSYSNGGKEVNSGFRPINPLYS